MLVSIVNVYKPESLKTKADFQKYMYIFL